MLRQNDLHTSVADDLCFQAGSPARHMGLLVLAECGVGAISLPAVTAATDTQISCYCSKRSVVSLIMRRLLGFTLVWQLALTPSGVTWRRGFMRSAPSNA